MGQHTVCSVVCTYREIVYHERVAKQHYAESVPLKDKQKYEKFLAEGEELVLVTSLSHGYLREIGIMTFAFPGLVFMIGITVYEYVKTSGNTKAVGAGLLLGLGIALLLGVIRGVMAYHANKFLLTTRRVLVKKGFFAVDLTSALYDKITHIEVVQNFMDRLLLHHGRIIINTAGMNKNEIILPYVDYPIEFKNVLERLINREREQMGRQTGPVQTLEGELID